MSITEFYEVYLPQELEKQEREFEEGAPLYKGGVLIGGDQS